MQNRLFLNKVHFKGFKSIEDLQVDFEKGLNILIGKNASGKSNFLECLNLAMSTGVSLKHLKSSYKYTKIEFVSSDKNTFILETEKETPSQISLFKDENIEKEINIKEKLFINNKIGYDSSSNKRLLEYIVYQSKRVYMRNNIRYFFLKVGYNSINPLYLKFNLPENLDCISISGTLKIEFNEIFDRWNDLNTLYFLVDLFWSVESSYKGEINKIKKINKTSFLNHLKIKEEIKENLKKYSPIQDVKFNENLNIYKDEKSITIENLKIDFKINNKWVPWSLLSDGTKRLFYIIAEISNLESGFVLVEEPELGIHPHQFSLIMEFLKKESESKQIIISTHSPQALNQLNENELSQILITSYDSKKGTQIKHLTVSQKKKAIRYMNEVGFLSDYWLLSDLE